MINKEVYRYRITKLEGGTKMYGPCEVCGKPVDASFIQTEEREYKGTEGVSWTRAYCHTLFGHEKCLLNKRR